MLLNRLLIESIMLICTILFLSIRSTLKISIYIREMTYVGGEGGSSLMKTRDGTLSIVTMML